MSKLLGIHQALALLPRLEHAARDYAAQLEKLEAEYRRQAAAAKQELDRATWQLAAQLNESLAAAGSALDEGRAHCQARFEKRQSRIQQAQRASRRQAVERIQMWEGRRKYQLQRSVLETDKGLDADLANTAAQCETFKQNLAATREVFVLLEAEAQKAFRGYAKFRRWLSQSGEGSPADGAADEYQLQQQLNDLHAKTRHELDRFRRMFLPRLFGTLSVWLLSVLLILGCLGLVPLFRANGWELPGREEEMCVGGLLVLLFSLYVYGRFHAGPGAKTIAASLARARWLDQICQQKAGLRLVQEQQRLKQVFAATKASLDQQWRETEQGAAEQRANFPGEIEAQERRLFERNEQVRQATLAQLEQQHQETMARRQQDAEAQRPQFAAAYEATLAKLKAELQGQRQALAKERSSDIQGIVTAIDRANAAVVELFPPWDDPRWETWSPPPEFQNAAPFGRLEAAVEAFAQLTSGSRPPELPAALSIPLLLTYPNQGSILFETSATGREEAVQAINSIVFRLLSTTPAGKVSFTIIDPIGLGQSFAGLMHLADYAESYVNGRIWTQTQQIEEKLAELNEQIEKVIQMYLRNEYATIAEYNARAGAIAEKYHFLVIAGFPLNFSETAGRRLLNIAASGARCGIYTLIHWDHRHELPHDFLADELRKNSVCVVHAESAFELAEPLGLSREVQPSATSAGPKQTELVSSPARTELPNPAAPRDRRTPQPGYGRRRPGLRLVLEAPPPPEFATRFLHQVGQTGKGAARVEVPFADVAPPEAEFWTSDTTHEVRVAIGRSGATKLQYLAIGQGTRQHALIAGKTGSGKSTLFHVIITNLALACSPAQIEFYLVDFKKGVEFKCYATHRLPHARVVAIESDREFGLSVLQRVDEELRRRGEWFRQLGVQDLPGYKKAGGAEAVPRCLLIIDEFQEFFVAEDRIAQTAALLLDRIVRQGRAFGIHVLLGSQTLGGAYTLTRATLGQMVIRIALQCNEADAYLIMDETNAAPRLLSRPGEGIYNAAAGALEGNSPFQTVWLPDEEREAWLARIRARADLKSCPGPVIFEGNAPADVQDNAVLAAALETAPVAPPKSARIWLGAPNSIKGPTEVVFHSQSGLNLLIVGQREEPTLALLSIALVSLAAQYPAGAVRLVFLDTSPPGSRPREFLDAVIRALPQPVLRPKHHELGEVLDQLATDLRARAETEGVATGLTTFVLLHGLENFKRLRQEDDFSFSTPASGTGPSPAAQFLNLITEGPGHGLHVIASCDSYNNVARFLGRKTLTEIAVRVLFQMSATDSANLIEGPDASNLGLHRALLFHDQEGYLETFRPYALPSAEWLASVARHFASRLPSP